MGSELSGVMRKITDKRLLEHYSPRDSREKRQERKKEDRGKTKMGILCRLILCDDAVNEVSRTISIATITGIRRQRQTTGGRDKRQGPIWILALTRRKLHSRVGAVIMGLVDAIGEILGRAPSPRAFRRVRSDSAAEKG